MKTRTGSTEFYVDTVKESGRWHWKIIGPLPKRVGAAGIRETCCTETKNHAGTCQGFDNEEAAKKDGSRRVKELESRGRS